MAIWVSILIGTCIGSLASFVYRSSNSDAFTRLGVGILGALLGLATSAWLGRGPLDWAYCEYVASGAGSMLLLLLWVVAQRLFLATPPPVARD